MFLLRHTRLAGTCGPLLGSQAGWLYVGSMPYLPSAVAVLACPKPRLSCDPRRPHSGGARRRGFEGRRAFKAFSPVVTVPNPRALRAQEVPPCHRLAAPRRPVPSSRTSCRGLHMPFLCAVSTVGRNARAFLLHLRLANLQIPWELKAGIGGLTSRIPLAGVMKIVVWMTSPCRSLPGHQEPVDGNGSVARLHLRVLGVISMPQVSADL